MERWSEAAWVPATSNAGAFTGGAAKGLLHTTEGGSYAGALSVYLKEGYWPHATLTFERGWFEAYQHLDLDVSAKALEHREGTGATNTDHVIQVEIVGSADRAWATKKRLLYVEDFPVEYLAGIARWMRYVEKTAGVLPMLIAPFGPPGTVRRLTWPEWHGSSGWCGHCHVPGNHHTDPGNIPIRTLIPTPTPKPPRPSTPLPVPPRPIIFPEDHMARIPVQLPVTANGAGWWVLDGSDGDGTPAGPARPAVPFDKWLGAQPGINGQYHKAPSGAAPTVTVCMSDNGFAEIGWANFPAGSAPVVFITTSA